MSEKQTRFLACQCDRCGERVTPTANWAGLGHGCGGTWRVSLTPTPARSEAAEMPDAEFFREVDEAQDAIRARRRAARSEAAGGEDGMGRLSQELDMLLMDEDLTDEKLREAAEGLLPNVADAFRSLRQQLAAAREDAERLDWMERVGIAIDLSREAQYGRIGVGRVNIDQARALEKHLNAARSEPSGEDGNG